MYLPLHASQIKAARAMLDWSQEDLAALAGLSITTIRQMELGAIAPRGATTNVVRKAIEGAGIEFLDSEGVRRRLDGVNTYWGPDSCDLFFQDLMRTVSGNDGEILVIAESRTALAQVCGVNSRHDLERLAQLKAVANVKCIVWDTAEPPFAIPSFQIRALSKQQTGPVDYFIYGDKQALIHPKRMGHVEFTVLRYMGLVQAYRDHFLSLWGQAIPLAP